MIDREKIAAIHDILSQPDWSDEQALDRIREVMYDDPPSDVSEDSPDGAKDRRP